MITPDSPQAESHSNNAAALGIYDYDVAAGIVHCDARIRSLWGLDNDGVITYDVFIGALHPDDQYHVQASVAQALEAAETGHYHAEYRVVNRIDGVTRWIAASGQVVVEQGRAVRLVAVAQDVSARKQREDALRESEEKYRTLFDLFSQGFCICEMLVDENGHPYDYRFLEVNQLFEEYTGLKDATGKTAMEMVPNLERHWVEIYGTVALRGTPLRFEQGSLVMGRWFDVYAFRFGKPENLKFAIVFNDISERRRAEERGQLLQRLASSLSTGMSQQEITEIIIQKGFEGLGASGGTVAILSNDKSHLEIVGSLGYPAYIIEKWKRIPLMHPTAPIAFAVRQNMQLWMRNPQERLELIPLTPNISAEEQHIAWAVLPFNIDDDVIGVISLGFDTPKEFDAPEQTFLNTLTEYCAQALHRAKLTEQIAPLAAAKERQRLSRDLHDSVKQLLFASSAIAQNLPKVWQRNPERGKEYTEDVVNLNQAALAELQSLLLEMRPEAIVSTPFMTLVKNLCVGLRGHKNLTININHDGQDELFFPPDTHIALYRLVQETLNNVNKHSDATQLDITCNHDSALFHIAIRDNGKGFDAQEISTGFGMSTMHERAEAIGATVSVNSVVGQGTEVVVELWLKDAGR